MYKAVTLNCHDSLPVPCKIIMDFGHTDAKKSFSFQPPTPTGCFYEVEASCRSETCTPPLHFFLSWSPWTPNPLLRLSCCSFLRSTAGRGPSCYIAPTYVCVCACVSSCTHTQLMKSKCPAAVVTVVRLSRRRHSEATTRPDWSWSKHVWEQQINWSPREFFFPSTVYDIRYNS